MTRTGTDPAASMALLRDLMRDDVGRDYADAAARHRAALTETGAVRAPDGADRRDRWRRPSWTFLITVVVVGAVLAVGLVQRRADEPQATALRQALVDRAVATEDVLTGLESANAVTRADIETLQQATLADSVAGEALATRIDALSTAAGYTAVTGPGLVVELQDAKGIERGDTNAPGRVLDRDVQTAVNGLWQAGAEAIAVNGRRLTTTTAIRTAGSAILVDFRPLVPPYRVEAIGNPATLSGDYAATRSAQSLEALVGSYGLRISTTPQDRIDLPAAMSLLPTRARVPVGARTGGGGAGTTSSSGGTP